jgi:hypothetical protein
LLACVFASSSLWAQEVAVRGTVRDFANRPISGASVSVPGLGVVTNDSGVFRLGGQTTGERILIAIRALDFVPVDTEVTVSDRAVSVILRRSVVSQPLAPVTVEATGSKPARYGATSKFDEFYRRRATGQGHFFTREDLERTSRTEAAYLLQGLNGVRVYPQRAAQKPSITMTRCLYGKSGIALFIDGQQTGSALTAAETLFELHVSDIEAMEVYTSQSQLPQEAIGSACGAVFVWTRYSHGSVLTKTAGKP